MFGDRQRPTLQGATSGRGISCGLLSMGLSGGQVLQSRSSPTHRRASLILTSNKCFADWGEVLGYTVIATAILERLLHHATTVNIKGESYRLKEKRKAGLLGKTKPPRPGSSNEKTAT